MFCKDKNLENKLRIWETQRQKVSSDSNNKEGYRLN